MIEKKDILKMVQHISRRERGIPDSRLIHPNREWFIGIILVTLVVIAGLVYAWWQYQKYNAIDNIIVTSTVSSAAYDEVGVGRVIQYYQERQARFDQLLAGVPAPVVVSDESVEAVVVATSSDSTVTTDTDAENDEGEMVLPTDEPSIEDDNTDEGEDEEGEPALQFE